MPIASCKICRKKFYAKLSARKRGWGQYCSSRCQYVSYLKGQFFSCAICGKRVWRAPRKIERSKSGKFFCSKKCQTIWRNQIFRGPLHANWKTGENVAYRELLIKSKIQQICKRCGLEDTRVLVAHHLDKNHKNNILKNLVWLCSNCHYLVHQHNVQVA